MKKKRWPLLVGVGLIYAGLWLLTFLAGAPQVRRDALRHMHLPASYQDVTGKAGSVGEKQYSCSAFALAPFLVRLDYAWCGAPGFGGSGTEFHAWLFGVSFRIG